ncbi:DUF4199 domain-containing protein [uncultured Kordia sp.]|uniref:DUF4199 domain-containing protein n=1 Tax=uncultured Kordia sp. TaxID=507699 RepID=UPI0026029273|nr:DUF4199 domain-containing protein [uncultured Kordia sp.]
MKTTIKKYGLYALIIALSLFFIALYFGKGLSFKAQEVVGYITMVVCLIPIFFGIKHYRDHENNGAVNFKEGFIIGISIALCAAIGFAIIDYIFVSYINPDFPEQYLAYSIDNINASDLSAEEKLKEITYAKDMMQQYGTPAFGALLMFAMVFILGIIISILSAFTLQRKSS